MKPTRQIPFYGRKSLSMSVKDVDPQTRRVQVMLSHFDNMDSDGDIIRQGAFAKSISERGAESMSNRKIAFLRHHDWEHQIGKWIKLEETAEGLIGIGELGRSTKGTDALLDYQDEIIREHSIGFNYVSDKMEFVEHGDAGYWEIKEVQLWEGSAVTFGANSETPTLTVSKGNSKEILEKLNNKMTALTKALKNGKGTDERLYSFEMQLKGIQQQYNEIINSLVSKEPTKQVTPERKPEPDNDTQKQFYLTLLSR
jgi:HK97 family phage prohead protease